MTHVLKTVQHTSALVLDAVHSVCNAAVTSARPSDCSLGASPDNPKSKIEAYVDSERLRLRELPTSARGAEPAQGTQGRSRRWQAVGQALRPAREGVIFINELSPSLDLGLTGQEQAGVGSLGWYLRGMQLMSGLQWPGATRPATPLSQSLPFA